MSEYKEVMKWYSNNKKLVYDTFLLNHQLGISSEFKIREDRIMVISQEGYPDIKEPGNNFSWRFKFLQKMLKKLLVNTVQR